MTLSIEVFHHPDDYDVVDCNLESPEPGWYWWECSPGYLPTGDPIGPFETEDEAVADAQAGLDDGTLVEQGRYYVERSVA